MTLTLERTSDEQRPLQWPQQQGVNLPALLWRATAHFPVTQKPLPPLSENPQTQASLQTWKEACVEGAEGRQGQNDPALSDKAVLPETIYTKRH